MAVINRNVTEKTGECESCDKQNTAIYQSFGMWLCSDCKSAQDAAIARQSAIDVIEKSHKVDETIKIQSDIFNAATVSFAELKASIDNASDTSQAEKDFALFTEASNRIKTMNAAIIASEQALMKQKNERHGWLTQVQDLVATLRADYRAKAKSFDLSYEPVSPKTPKSKVPTSTTSNTFTKKVKDELNEAAAKYGVPAQMVRITMVQLRCNADVAAKRAAINMGLIPDDGSL